MRKEEKEEERENGEKKGDAERKSRGEKSPLVSLFLFRDARLFTFHPVHIRVQVRVYIYIRERMDVYVCIQGVPCMLGKNLRDERHAGKKRSDFSRA